MGARRPSGTHRRGGSRTLPAEDTKAPSWLRRISAGVLGAGALAAAISAVIGLWPSPDPVDKVTITSAHLSWPEPLSAYGSATGDDSGTAAPLGAQPTLGAVPARYTTTSAPPPSAGRTSSTTTTASSSTSSTPTATGSTGTTGRSSSPTSTSETYEPSTTEDTPEVATPTVEPPDVLRLPPSVRDHFYEEIVADPALAEYALPPHLPGESVVFICWGSNVVGKDGQPVPPAQAAQQFAARLADVRTQPVEGRLDPLGVRVTVDMEIEGLRDQPLLLYWRMVPAGGTTPLAPDWGRPTASYIVTAGTERDTATIEVWVPLPEAAGPYELDLLVGEQSAGLPLASYRTDAFG